MDLQTEEHIEKQVSNLEKLHFNQKLGLISEIAAPFMEEIGCSHIHLYGMTPYFNDGDECEHHLKGWVGYPDGIAMYGGYGAPLTEYFSKDAKPYIHDPKYGYTHRKNGYALQHPKDINGYDIYGPPYEAISTEYGLPNNPKPYPIASLSALEKHISKLLGTNFIVTLTKTPDFEDVVVRYYPYTDHE